MDGFCLYISNTLRKADWKQVCAVQVGKLVRGVTVGHVERPGLVWINAPPTEQSDQLLKEVSLNSFTSLVFNQHCLCRWR